jgi:hypothetical protein
MRWLRWNWLDQGLLPLLLALLRFCWLWPWLNLLPRAFAANPPPVLLAPGLIIGLPILSFTLASLAPTQEVEGDRPSAAPKNEITWRARLGIGLVGLLAILFCCWWQRYQQEVPFWHWQWLITLGNGLIHWDETILPVTWLLLLAAIYLWLRGLLDAGQSLGHDDIWGTVVTGIWALVLYLIVMATLHLALPAGVINLIILFFAASMIALALTSLKITIGLDMALGFGQRRTSKAPPTTRYWLLSVLVVVLVLLGLGVGLALLIAPEQIARLLQLMAAVISFIWRIIALVLVAISYVLVVLAYYIALLLEPLIRRLLAALADTKLLQFAKQPDMTPTPQPAPLSLESVPDPYRWLALAIFAIVVVVIFALVMRRLRAAQAETQDEVRESILTADLLQSQLAALWQKLLGRFRSGATLLNPFLALDGEAESRRLIRAAYQQLLTVATTLGQTRQPSQTPGEYQQTLVNQWSTSNSALSVITHHYNHARYAPDAPPPNSVDAVQQAWADVQHQVQPPPAQPEP